MITESFQNYKGYIIRLRAKTNGRFGYSIIKQKDNLNSPNGIKNVILRQIIFNYIEPEVLLKKAKDYIDSYESLLIEKFKQKLLQ